jgi:hypothetical protein
MGLQETWRGSASYVTGAHNMKFGYMGAYHASDGNYFSNNTHLTYRLNNGVPNQFTMDLNPFSLKQRTRYEALYGQEQWTAGRLTLQGALRYEHAWSYFPEQQVGPVKFLLTPSSFRRRPASSTQRHHPRVGAAYYIRERQNVPQGERRQVSRGGHQPQYVFGVNPTARMVGSSSQLTAPPPVTVD